MVEIKEYLPENESKTIARIADFFGFHAELAGVDTDISDESLREAAEILKEWLTGDNSLFVIYFNNVPVGFLRLCYRGDIVAWIEDIYVDAAFRGKGIATESIHLAEEIVKGKPGYVAVCLDVAPRNSEALNLYHKLGYTDISLITLRKEFGESKRDKPVDLFGRKFRY